MKIYTTEAQFKTDRKAFFERLEAAKKKDEETQAVYGTHMAKVAHHLYLAGEAVKKGEFGYAESQHQLAAMNIRAAVKCLPTGNAIAAATFAPPISL